jgi:hypothetical protein
MRQDPRFPSTPALRLRRFLHQRGLRLEAWATQEQILETFLAHLAHDEHDDAYWDELTELAERLATDLRQRRPRSALTEAISVDPDDLMKEIRAGLAQARTRREDFRSLGRTITGPAMSLLLLITLVAVGCGGQTDRSRELTPSTGGTGGAAASAGGTAELGGTAGMGGFIIELPAGMPPACGQSTGVVPSGGEGGTAGCFPPAMTIRELLETCVDDPDAREAYLGALALSHPDWSQFIADYFRCGECGAVADYLQYCVCAGNVGVDADPPDESSNIYDLCSPIIIYAGVRFT